LPFPSVAVRQAVEPRGPDLDLRALPEGAARAMSVDQALMDKLDARLGPLADAMDAMRDEHNYTNGESLVFLVLLIIGHLRDADADVREELTMTAIACIRRMNPTDMVLRCQHGFRL
jgi:hypothetical protein